MKPRYLFTLAVLAITGAAGLGWMGATAAEASAPGRVQRHPDGTLSLVQTIDFGPSGAPMLLQATAVPAPREAGRARVLASPRTTVPILSEDFEGPEVWPPAPVPEEPFWSVFDGDGAAGGEYFWGETDFRAHNGSWSVWCARGGANGHDPATDPTYRDNMRSWAIFGPFNLVDALGASLNFYHYLHSEQDRDYFWWLASIDGSRFYGYAQSGNPDQDQWSSVMALDFKYIPFLGNVLGQSQVWIAFLFTSDDANHGSLGAFMDEIEVTMETETKFDLIADRVYLADADGNKIYLPEVGEEVYFWFDWHVNGVGTTMVPFIVECRLDDEVHTYEIRDAEGGHSYSTRSNLPWIVEAGEHSVEWRLDPKVPPEGEEDKANVIPETNESNNNASVLLNPPTRPAWSYLVYLNSDTDIAGGADQALYALEDGASNPNINIVVLLDGNRTNDSVVIKADPDRVYQFGMNMWRVGTYGLPYGEAAETNMGHPDTLANFVNWARGAFPADHYALCIWDHAYYPDPAVPHLVRGICWDHAGGGDYLTMPELTTALEAIAAQRSGPLEVVHFSTDLMGMSEVVYQVAGAAQYVVASENPVATPEPYGAYLSGVTSLTTGRELAQTIVDEYHLAMGGLGHTMAAYDMAVRGPVMTALENLALSLITGLTNLRTTFQEAISAAWGTTQKLDGDGGGVCNDSDVYVDLADLAGNLVSRLTGLDPLVQDAQAKAQALETALAVGPSDFIFNEGHGSGPNPTGGTYNLAGARGIAIYFPPSPDSPGWLPYNNLEAAADLAMVAQTHWDEFLRAYFTALAAPSDFSHSTQTTDSITWIWMDNSYDEDGFRVYDEGDNLKATAGPNETSVVEGGLAPNTLYTRYVTAYKGVDESGPSNLASAYTLPVAPDVSADPLPPGPYPVDTVFTFTNVAGFGAGSLDHYGYVWDTEPTHTWDGTEEVWDTGTLQVSATGEGIWYLHLNSYNPAGESGGTLDYEPFVVGDLTAPSDFGYSTKTTDSITWTWVDNSSIEESFRIYDELNNLKATAGADETSLTEGGLAPNTQYTRYVVAYHLVVGESAPSNQAIVHTLPAAPSVSADPPPPGPYPMGTMFVFTNLAGFGAGGVEYYRIVWDISPTHAWTDTEQVWNSGTLQVSPAWVGNWYLHVKSYNAAAESSGTLDSGPFVIGSLEAPSDFGASDKTTDSITWTWVDNSANEDGFRVYDDGDNLKATAGANETSVTEGGLTPNTPYTRYVVAYNAAMGESAHSNEATVYTLPVAPDVTADPAPPGPYPVGTLFTFTNQAGFGPGSLDHYRVVWDTNAAHAWTDTETMWSGGTLEMTGSYMGSWYLHVNSYNTTADSGGAVDYGPFLIAERFDCTGWNLVSLPFDPVDPDPWEVFDELRPPAEPIDRLSGSLYRYDVGLQTYVGYQQSDPAAFGDVNTHDGYWLLLQDPLDLMYDYIEPPASPTPDSRLLAQAWNLLGPGSPSDVPLAEALFSRGGGEPVPFAEAVANGWVQSPTYPYNCSIGSYESVGLPGGVWHPWQGFWFNVIETDVTMIVNVVAP